MSEYVLDFWQWRDLKWAVEQRNWEEVESIMRSVENRWWALELAQAHMINEFHYPYSK